MLEIVKTDIFELDCQIITCPVNCVGVMGAGLARKTKEKYPECEELYQNFCSDNILNTSEGEWGLAYLNRKKNPLGILFLPTKNHWKESSKLENILKGVTNFLEDCSITEMVSHKPAYQGVGFPKLGCGFGNLDWAEVKPKLINAIESYSLLTTFYISEFDK